MQELPKESHYIREIVDKHQFKDVAIHKLSRKKLIQVINLLLIYVPFLEHTLKQHKIKELDTDLENKNEQPRKTEDLS